MTDPNNPLVLIVDDEPNIRDAVAFTLKREGFRVLTAATGPEALEQARSKPDVILLDIMLPGMDGLEVLRRLRTTSNVPVLMLSAKGEEVDRVIGLEIGADDYITKPFAMRELVARVRAVVRRVGMQVQSAETGWIEVGRLSVNTTNRQVKVDDELVELKPKEFDLLLYFTRHPGVVLSRDALLREVWGYDFQIDTRTVDVHIRWLRTKLEVNPAEPRMLITVRGAGYRFVPDAP